LLKVTVTLYRYLKADSFNPNALNISSLTFKECGDPRILRNLARNCNGYYPEKDTPSRPTSVKLTLTMATEYSLLRITVAHNISSSKHLELRTFVAQNILSAGYL
jgi:hypothetical protein